MPQQFGRKNATALTGTRNDVLGGQWTGFPIGSGMTVGGQWTGFPIGSGMTVEDRRRKKSKKVGEMFGGDENFHTFALSLFRIIQIYTKLKNINY